MEEKVTELKNIREEVKQEIEEKTSLNIFNDEEEDLLVSQLNMDITNQYVVFSVGDEEYGLPILSVQEIISLPLLTRIPGVPDYIPGIINLRGNIIPLYILRTKFHMQEQKLDNNSIVVIVQTGNESNKTVGFIVDSVSDVVSITDEDFQKAPEFTENMDNHFIDKIGHVGSRMIVIIDMENFFTDKDKQILEEASDSSI